MGDGGGGSEDSLGWRSTCSSNWMSKYLRACSLFVVALSLKFLSSLQSLLSIACDLVNAFSSSLLKFINFSSSFKHRNYYTTAHHRHHQIEHWMQEGKSCCVVYKFWEKKKTKVLVLYNFPEYQIVFWPLRSIQVPNLLLPLGITWFIFSSSLGRSSSSTRCNILELTILYSSIGPLTRNLPELDRLISHIKAYVILQYMLKHIDNDSNTVWKKEQKV